MLIRLAPAFGGDGTTCGAIAMNDTGSDIMTVFQTDFARLGNTQGYRGWLSPIDVIDANGRITTFPRILVQVQLVRNDNTQWGNWIYEDALVKPAAPGVSRLSGRGIRRHLYIGTAPGNHLLAVAATKGGLTSLL
jgi:hypothetical protein